jgi:hypothetical protein
MLAKRRSKRRSKGDWYEGSYKKPTSYFILPSLMFSYFYFNSSYFNRSYFHPKRMKKSHSEGAQTSAFLALTIDIELNFSLKYLSLNSQFISISQYKFIILN